MKRVNNYSQKLPWSTDEYVRLDPQDFAPTPAPTAEQRVRIAAALATKMRDAVILGIDPMINAEAVRAVLTMDAEAWARDISVIPREARDIASVAVAYDTADPKRRFHQLVAYRMGLVSN